MTRLPTFVLALVVPVIALLAVIGTRVVEGPSSSGAVQARANEVVIKNFSLSRRSSPWRPEPSSRSRTLTVPPTPLLRGDGSFDTGDLDGGKHATVGVAKSGTFAYFCEIHNFMTGTLVVK